MRSGCRRATSIWRSVAEVSRIQLRALEINAVLHCNLSCRGCSHASPAAARWFADPVVVERDLRLLSHVATTEHVRVLGGEPLLHPDLRGVLAAVRASGIRGRIRVVTNATRLHLAPWDWLECADEVHVSIYPGTSVQNEALAELERQCRLGKKGLLVKRYHGFRLVHPVRPLQPEQAETVFATCQLVHAWGCHTVHEGALYLCPVSAPPYEALEDERCALEPAATLRPRLEAFLARQDPLAACTNCLGTVGALVPHAQVSKAHWRAASFAGVIDEAHVAAIRADPFADLECSSVELELPSGATAASRPRGRGGPTAGAPKVTVQRARRWLRSA
jgi:organic radical activating enzyme